MEVSHIQVIGIYLAFVFSSDVHQPDYTIFFYFHHVDMKCSNFLDLFNKISGKKFVLAADIIFIAREGTNRSWLNYIK